MIEGDALSALSDAAASMSRDDNGSNISDASTMQAHPEMNFNSTSDGSNGKVEAKVIAKEKGGNPTGNNRNNAGRQDYIKQEEGDEDDENENRDELDEHHISASSSSSSYPMPVPTVSQLAGPSHPSSPAEGIKSEPDKETEVDNRNNGTSTEYANATGTSSSKNNSTYSPPRDDDIQASSSSLMPHHSEMHTDTTTFPSASSSNIPGPSYHHHDHHHQHQEHDTAYPMPQRTYGSDNYSSTLKRPYSHVDVLLEAATNANENLDSEEQHSPVASKSTSQVPAYTSTTSAANSSSSSKTASATNTNRPSKAKKAKTNNKSSGSGSASASVSGSGSDHQHHANGSSLTGQQDPNNTSNNGIAPTTTTKKSAYQGPKISMACYSCRTSKTRCSGTSPCKRCELKKMDCRYPLRDGRTVHRTSVSQPSTAGTREGSPFLQDGNEGSSSMLSPNHYQDASVAATARDVINGHTTGPQPASVSGGNSSSTHKYHDTFPYATGELALAVPSASPSDKQIGNSNHLHDHYEDHASPLLGMTSGREIPSVLKSPLPSATAEDRSGSEHNKTESSNKLSSNKSTSVIKDEYHDNDNKSSNTHHLPYPSVMESHPHQQHQRYDHTHVYHMTPYMRQQQQLQYSPPHQRQQQQHAFPQPHVRSPLRGVQEGAATSADPRSSHGSSASAGDSTTSRTHSSLPLEPSCLKASPGSAEGTAHSTVRANGRPGSSSAKDHLSPITQTTGTLAVDDTKSRERSHSFPQRYASYGVGAAQGLSASTSASGQRRSDRSNLQHEQYQQGGVSPGRESNGSLGSSENALHLTRGRPYDGPLREREQNQRDSVEHSTEAAIIARGLPLPYPHSASLSSSSAYSSRNYNALRLSPGYHSLQHHHQPYAWYQRDRFSSTTPVKEEAEDPLAKLSAAAAASASINDSAHHASELSPQLPGFDNTDANANVNGTSKENDGGANIGDSNLSELSSRTPPLSIASTAATSLSTHIGAWSSLPALRDSYGSNGSASYSDKMHRLNDNNEDDNRSDGICRIRRTEPSSATTTTTRGGTAFPESLAPWKILLYEAGIPDLETLRSEMPFEAVKRYVDCLAESWPDVLPTFTKRFQLRYAIEEALGRVM